VESEPLDACGGGVLANLREQPVLDAAPERAVLIVGQTQSEAEARARQWAERL